MASSPVSASEALASRGFMRASLRGAGAYKADKKQVAVVASREVSELKAKDNLANEPVSAGRVQNIADKTFYLKDGFWTESSCLGSGSGSAKLVTFGSKQYFALLSANPGISKYLSVGKQVIFKFNGVVYKVVQSRAATS